MSRYGRDFSSGRYGWRDMSEQGGSYDRGYRRHSQWNRPWMSDRNEFGGYGSWGTPTAWRGEEMDESWGSMGHGRGRSGFGSRGWQADRWHRPDQFGGYGSADRDPQYGYGRGMYGRGGRLGEDYDDGVGDRLRRGWNRLRDEARGFMDRGYDRGW